MNSTIDYYNKNADTFIEGTVSVDFTENQDRFLEKLAVGASILDFGCGSGRDTKYFLEKGYRVRATDGSEAMCKAASFYSGIKVSKMLFQELHDVAQYDGIWACASVLHLSKKELKVVFEKMETALKPDGIIYTSFKYSEFEGIRNGRYFTDFTLESFQAWLEAVPGLEIEDYWFTGDVRPGRADEKWLNLILRKCEPV